MNVWRWAVLLWIGVIFFSSTSLAGEWAEGGFDFFSDFFPSVDRSSPSYGVAHLAADKGLHITLFCVLALLLWMALAPSPRKRLLILAIGAVVGSCSELLQIFFPDRDPAIRDLMINITGTAIGLLLAQAISRIRKRMGRQEYAASRN